MMKVAQFEGFCRKHEVKEHFGVKIIQKMNIGANDLCVVPAIKPEGLVGIKYVEIGRYRSFEEGIEEAKAYLTRFYVNPHYLQNL